MRAFACPDMLAGKMGRRSRAFAQQSVYREATWANADGRRLRERQGCGSAAACANALTP